MNANFVVRPIPLSRGARDLSSFTFKMNAGTPCESVCYSWYLDGPGPKTIVDAGQVGIDPIIGNEADGLAKFGLTPDDIEIVIITHLHMDHISLGKLFKNAKFYVQKTEYDYAMNPHPFDSFFYKKPTFEDIDFEFVDGEKEIIPGVTVFPTPGHTPGGQSVEISTAKGKVVISSVCSHLKTFEQIEPMKMLNWEVTIPLIHNDCRTCYDSVIKIRDRADFIIAPHDPIYADMESIPE